MVFNRTKRMHFQLNIAPLIDIVFLLLIFFLLTTNFFNERAINLALPKASHADEGLGEDILISLDRDGRIFLGSKEVSISKLPTLLKESVDKSTKKSVVIRGDRGVDFGLAVRLMDIAKGANAEGIVVATEPEGSK
ncbi:MAG: biopolymer transporter ExbD [Nitrospinae bacterium]|nr:biopolymer transporter ExbD [Nitrospinota bacterium]